MLTRRNVLATTELLIKPVSGNCNLQCNYCFYHALTEIRGTKSYGHMSVNTMERIINNAFLYADRTCTFAFQGGEPTLIGLDFYRNLVEIQQKNHPNQLTFHNAIQTNGVLIDEEWARFFSEHHFLVGLSLDGPKDIHDLLRHNREGKGSFSNVMNAVRLFDKYHVEYNILSTVNAYVAGHGSKTYNFFKKNGFRYLQFIPCLDPLDVNPGSFDHSLLPSRYADFLKTVFDLWYRDIAQGNPVSIRYFDNLVGMYMGQPPEMCGMRGECSCQFVIEANGGVYPCDFYVFDEWYMGNIMDQTFQELLASDAAVKFVNESRYVSPECSGCKWFALCRGGCRRSREPFLKEKPGLNVYCTAFWEFLEYADQRLQQLAGYFSSIS